MKANSHLNFVYSGSIEDAIEAAFYEETDRELHLLTLSPYHKLRLFLPAL